MNYKVLNGLVLKHLPVREADEYLTIWTWEEGKARVLARAVRKPESKLKAVLAPVAWLELQVVPRAHVHIAVAARVSKIYPRLLGKLTHLAVVFNLFELVLYATCEQQPNHQVSVLLRSALEDLEARDEVGMDFLNAFRLRFLASIGYGIGEAACRQCGKDIRHELQANWSGIHLGLVCLACGRHDLSVKMLSREMADYLFSFSNLDKPVVPTQLSQDTKLKLEALVSQMIQGVTERQMNSRAFLAENLKA